MALCCADDSKVDTSPKKHDKSFKGPIKSRSCTDIICCASFSFIVILFIVIGIFAFLNGNPELLLAPTDSDGNLCGYNDFTDRPNLLYFDIAQCASPASTFNLQCQTRQICVASCPTQFTSGQYFALQESLNPGSNFVNNDNLFCKYNTNLDQYKTDLNTMNSLFTNEICAAFTIPSTPILNRCIPGIGYTDDILNEVVKFNQTVGGVTSELDFEDHNGNKVSYNSLIGSLSGVSEYLNYQPYLTQALSDFNSSWYFCIILMLIGGFVSLIWVFLMRFIVGPMVWLTLLSLVSLIGFGIYGSYSVWNNLKTFGGEDSQQSLTSVGFTTDLSVYLNLQETWLAFMIILSCLELVLLLMLLFLRKRIKIAVAVMGEASRAIGSMLSAYFYPLITYSLLFVLSAYYILSVVYVASSFVPTYRTYSVSGDATHQSELCDPNNFTSTSDDIQCIFVDFSGDQFFYNNQILVQIVLLSIFLWIGNFILALGEMVLAGAFSSYYWAFEKPKDVPTFPVFASLYRSLRYHIGTLAFGSLIITIVQLARIALEYIDHKTKDSQNKLAKFIVCCLRCCLYCLEKFLRFVNRNAYIYTAIYGKNFCSAGKAAFSLIIRNVVRIFVLDKTVDFVLLVGKILVSAGTAGLAWAFFSNAIYIQNVDAPEVSNYWPLVVIIGLVVYFIASGFFSVYSMAVDTVFICFVEDLERNDGSGEKPYYMSKSLMSVMGKKNKKVK